MERQLDKNRMKHMYGVAEYMFSEADKYGLNPRQAYVAGLLHDIGYLYDRSHHEYYSKQILLEMGIDAKSQWLKAIHCHSMTPDNYKNHMQGEGVTITDRDIPKELILLWEADMSIDNTGNQVTYKKRLKDIAAKYGKTSHEYISSKARIEWLKSRKNKC